MPRLVAFLRGINLGKRRPPMSQLAALFVEAGFQNVATFIASGNVLFSTTARPSRALEERIERHLKDRLGYAVDTFVRPLSEVQALVARRVFEEEGREGITVSIAFLHEAPSPEVAATLKAIRTPDDELRVLGRELHWLCRIRTPDSKLWSLPAVRALRLPTMTFRNITSLRKLVAEHGET